jgi:hypothetical protein
MPETGPPAPAHCLSILAPYPRAQIRSDDADWAKIAAQHNDRRSVVFMSKRQLIVTPDFFPEVCTQMKY